MYLKVEWNNLEERVGILLTFEVLLSWICVVKKYIGSCPKNNPLTIVGFGEV